MKNVLITGGSRGIGAECVKLFSERGYRVFFIYRNNHEEAAKLSEITGALPFCGDVSVPADIENIYDKIKDYEIWVAHYTEADAPSIPFPYRMWQYTSSASVEGANTRQGRCDVNYYQV